ncbi:MAG TPA: sigma-70 family RNA polymerase sigma factor [Rubrobacter sp.]|nr:sigma-70 family RNA polymerase sigma factor [Rubrobacter sp.]
MTAMALTRTRAAGDPVVDLIEAYRERGDRCAVEQILSMNVKILNHIVRRYASSSDESYEDLLQVGYVGMMKAVNGYKLDSEAKFSSYAYAMIEGEIKHHLRDTDLVKRPRWARSLHAKVSEATSRLTAELGRPPFIEEVADEVNVTPEGVAELMKLFSDTDVQSLDVRGDDDVDVSAIKSLRYETFSLPVEDRILLEQALESLTELQRKVVYLFFYKDLCQTEIGRKLGLSQRKTSRTVASAIKVLKNSEALKDSEGAGSWGLE